jgi:hypothetical protein
VGTVAGKKFLGQRLDLTTPRDRFILEPGSNLTMISLSTYQFNSNHHCRTMK